MRYLKTLGKVVCVGDFNICHNEIDLTHPKECSKRSVFLPIERQKFDALLNLGLYDCFRENHPDKKEYSWRSYSSRQSDIAFGKNFWKYRIDYILASFPDFESCEIIDLEYSDHLPVVINI